MFEYNSIANTYFCRASHVDCFNENKQLLLGTEYTITSEIQSSTKTKENAFLSYFVNTDGKL